MWLKIKWYKFYSSKYQFLPHHVAQIPWGHNRLIISKIKDIEEAEFYTVETAKNARDRDTLEVQIKNNYHLKLGNSANNFAITLPDPQSQLANQAVKDPYIFDFLGLEQDALELAVEDELTKHIMKFLLELGKGFAFIGRQYKIEI
jgi:predicted nuclease of restriction endonuclease-like (RecB) superfamily